MSTRLKKVFNDPSRFEGNGVSYKAKLIGIEDVPEARGDAMCYEALNKLKNSVKISGEHKRKVFVNVTLEGLKIIDAISLNVLHTHPVHRISFIARDPTDNRAFGYVFGTEGSCHKFFAIKTAAAAENLVLTLKDLFQVVYELKKREVEEAKEKLQKGELQITSGPAENYQPSGTGSTSGIGQTPAPKAAAETENIYQVPTNNAPVKPENRAEQVAANLLDLEDQAENILKGIEQIKNLDFNEVPSDTFSSPSSPTSSLSAKLTSLSPTASPGGDLWGFPSGSPANSTSSLGDLMGLQTGQFQGLTQQPFLSPGLQLQAGRGAPQGLNLMGQGLPVMKDPYSPDPFGSAVQQSRPVPGFGSANLYGLGFSQPFGVQAAPPRFGMMGVPGMHGMVSPPVMGGLRSPYGFQQVPGFQTGNPFGEDPNILQPLKKDSGEVNQESLKPSSKTREDLFGDLLDIKKSTPASAKTPKDLFAQKNAPDKKPMNELRGQARPSANFQGQASAGFSDPFGDLKPLAQDRSRGHLFTNSEAEDPFDTSHIPPSLIKPSRNINPTNVRSASRTPPPIPTRPASFCSQSIHKSAPSTSFLRSLSSSSSSSSPSSPVLSLSPACSPPPLPISDLTGHEMEGKDWNDNYTNKSSLHSFFPEVFNPSHMINASSSLSSSSADVKYDQPLSFNNVHNPHTRPRNESQENDDAMTGANNVSSPTNDINAARIKDLPESQNIINIISHAPSPDDAKIKLKVLETCHKIDQEVKNISETSPFMQEHVNPCNNTNLTEPAVSNLHRSHWVGFDNCDDSGSDRQSGLFLPVSQTGHDPFSLPVHVSPGFKAVAKFGSDPFDDNLFNEESWDPFVPFNDDLNFVSHTS